MFMTVEEAIQHIQSGSARIMLKSNVTNNQYRYWIRESSQGKSFSVYLISSEGELAFMGLIRKGDFERTEKSRVDSRAPAYVAFNWTWNHLCHNRLPPSDVEIIPIQQ